MIYELQSVLSVSLYMKSEVEIKLSQCKNICFKSKEIRDFYPVNIRVCGNKLTH